MICHWAINITDPQNSLSTTLDVPLHGPARANYRFFLMKNTGATMGNLEGQIRLVHRFSFRKVFNLACSNRNRG